MPHIDLDAIRPPNSSFTWRGTEYQIPGEVAAESIIEMLQLREGLDADEEGTALVAMLKVVHDLLDECPENAGKPKPRLSMEEISQIMTLAMGGDPAIGDTPETVAKQVVQGTLPEAQAPTDEERPEGDPTPSTPVSEATAPAPANA